MNQDLIDQDFAEVPLRDDVPSPEKGKAAPGEFLRRLDECAILLDIDGTLLDLAPTPREVWVPPGLAKTLNGLLDRTAGALALVSGRSLNDIDLIFAPEQFPAVGGHGAEMRISTESEAVATHAPPMDKELKRRLAAIAKAQPRHPARGQGLFAGTALPAGSACGEGDLRGGIANQSRSAERADRSAAGKMRLRDQAFRL